METADSRCEGCVLGNKVSPSMSLAAAGGSAAESGRAEPSALQWNSSSGSGSPTEIWVWSQGQAHHFPLQLFWGAEMLVERIFLLPGSGRMEMLTEPSPSLRTTKCPVPKWILQCLTKTEHICSLSLHSSTHTATSFLLVSPEIWKC